MKDLIDFLKSMVMNTTLLDKKFRETIPEIVDHMKILVDSSDEESKRKKRKPKKMKLGKGGLYPTEVDHVRQWWNANKPELRGDEVTVNAQDVKYHICCLRTRETQLQAILILEILALETMTPAEGVGESQLPGLEVETPPKPTTSAISSKKRNKVDFPVLVDIHADRLCIWQTTTLDDLKAMAEHQTKESDGSKSHRASADPLRDYCVDII